MRKKKENVDHFLFRKVSISETERKLREWNSNKETMFVNIPIKILNKELKEVIQQKQRIKEQ